MNQPIQDIIEQRFSCRSYMDEPIKEKERRELHGLLNTQRIGPLGTHARFELAAATQDDRQSLKGLGTYGFIKNPAGFIVGAVKQGPKNLEEYGYLLEHIVLAATGMGLGTCWVGGIFTKSRFAKKISLNDDEIIPAIVATGYDADNNGGREFIRRQLKAHRRLPAEQLFYSDSFDRPVLIDNTDPYAAVLNMVRLAPSASNKQPWRIIRNGNAWHFYLERTKGYGKGTLLFTMLRLADLQRVDIGVAMCHFELTARSLKLHGRWIIEDPKMKTKENTEYIVTWINE